jgi:hypothetical protein
MAKEQNRIFYRRQQLAQKLAERVLSKTQVTAAVFGHFFGAPSRTGKTTFMR